MRTTWAVYKRELMLYFRSGIAYGIAFALMLVLGVLFTGLLSQMVNINITQEQGYTADDILSFNMSTFIFLMFIVAPLLTMRLLSEEAREGTLEVMMTLPLSDSAFVIGKFFAVWTYYTVILAISLFYVFIADELAAPDMNLTALMYFGAWLYGGAVLALSMIWSAVTQDQVVAAFLGAATILIFFLADTAAIWASGQTTTAIAADFIRELSLTAHYQDTMMAGIARAQDILYFVILIVASLFITTRLIEIRRWRA